MIILITCSDDSYDSTNTDKIDIRSVTENVGHVKNNSEMSFDWFIIADK